MRAFIFLLLISVFHFQVQASQEILDCNISAGPDQEVRVVRSADGSLELIELSNTGATIRRQLTSHEWHSGRLHLQTGDEGGTATLQRQSDGWFYTFHSNYSSVEAAADCQ